MADVEIANMSRDAVADALASADHAIALTGAGISTPSGVRDFRGENGLYGEFDQSDISIGRFERDPAGFWHDWVAIHTEQFDDDPVEPNPAHEALAGLETAGVLDALVTQNVDGLHRAGGSESILHLHGTAARSTCQDCGRTVETTSTIAGRDDANYPPRCEECGGVLKPDTVLFGERLPPGAMKRARRHAEETDVLLAAGSSLTVNPAASLPRTADRSGATVVIVNLDETPADSLADYVLREPVEDALPDIANRVLEAKR